MESIPLLTSRSALVEFFRQLGYRSSLGEWATDSLPFTARRSIASLHLIADHSNEDQSFQIFLAELGPLPPNVHRARRADLRPLVDYFLRNFPQGDYLFVFATPGYEALSFVSPRRTNVSRASLQLGLPTITPPIATEAKPEKLRLRLLVVNPRDLTRTDRDILRGLALGPNEQSPIAVLEKHLAAFNVEKVTDDFYREYRTAFDGLKAKMKGVRNSGQRHAVVQRLLSRLLFLCFLQKKYWLDQKPDYLFRLYDRAEEEGREFYDDFLHDLFFNGLNNYGREQLTLRAEVEDLHERIGLVPFLNGGLFEKNEPWDEPGRLKLPNVVLRPLLGSDGLLRRYNFTVAESTPDFQEVAVDPEMLGKVFESIVLQSESAEDYNAPDLRKATGSYYTPRIVVQFICREALRNCLTEQLASDPGQDADAWRFRLGKLFKIDASDGLDEASMAELRRLISPAEADRINAKLEGLRACDPAVGSGAFAVGLLQELVNLRVLCDSRAGGRDAVTARGPAYLYKTKLHFIQSTIYGVDIQAPAVEICKLRLWLSLVVDHELTVDPRTATREQFGKALEHVQPLPNLGFKIRQGDSLLEQIHGQPFRLEHLPTGMAGAVITRFQNQLEKAQTDFFSEQHPVKKRNLRRRALEARLKFTEHILKHLLASLPALQPPLFGDELPKQAELRRWREAEEAKLKKAQEELASLQRRLRPLFAKARLSAGDEITLDEVETGDDKNLTFVWQIAFPEVFRSRPLGSSGYTGFDLILGNPPFVTARNPTKRELYRERWKQTAYQKFQLVAPFFQRGFGLLRSGGHLGYIVSNAFAKREFGRPLVREFFPTVELHKIIDCSGLMFPGHGTPTCIVFGRRPLPLSSRQHMSSEKDFVRIAAILPGGGDLQTPPEDSLLWHILSDKHDEPGYSDERVVIADRTRKELSQWPWSFDVEALPTKEFLEEQTDSTLRDLLDENIGFDIIFGAREVYANPLSYWRQRMVPHRYLIEFVEGDILRDFRFLEATYTLFPYNTRLEADLPSAVLRLLSPWRTLLESRPQLGGKSQVDSGLKWYEYYRFTKRGQGRCICYPEIATQAHFVVSSHSRVFTQTAPVVKLPVEATINDYHWLAGAMNSSTAMFWLRQVCFSKREAEVAEEGTYLVFAGGKVQKLPIPRKLLNDNLLRRRLTSLSRACWNNGTLMSRLAYGKLFELATEAYSSWRHSLAGWPQPIGLEDRTGILSWQSVTELSVSRTRYASSRAETQGKMIALQEEMDWLLYEAYGLLPPDHPAVGTVQPNECPPLALGERPFELLRDGKPIPAHFPDARRALWQARLQAIVENEHVRRIEQPVYKRRWYRKVSDEQEFEQAFEWWLMEKAEWWLEHTASGGPVLLERWAAALWGDKRVRAAATAIGAESGMTLQKFTKLFKGLVAEASVPEDLPPAVPWEKLEARGVKVPVRAKKVRGKLNVPRERFRERHKGEYVWAGKK